MPVRRNTVSATDSKKSSADNSNADKTAKGDGEYEALIVVMGGTGSGKSSFINLASGSKLRIGVGLGSCTDNIQSSGSFRLGQRTVRLIDTPGFDDSSKTNTEILEIICKFLVDEYRVGRKLSGIIYMHRISDVRMGGVARRNLNIFQKLCGPDFFRNVAVVTSRWDEVEETVAKSREEELKTKPNFFKPVLDAGANMMRHNNTTASAHDIVMALASNKPKSLLVQWEMFREGKNISNTAAGVELHKELIEKKEMQRKAIQDLHEEMATIEAEDEQSHRELAEEVSKLREEMERLEAEGKRLSEMQYVNEELDFPRKEPESSSKRNPTLSGKTAVAQAGTASTAALTGGSELTKDAVIPRIAGSREYLRLPKLDMVLKDAEVLRDQLQRDVRKIEEEMQEVKQGNQQSLRRLQVHHARLKDIERKLDEVESTSKGWLSKLLSKLVFW